MNKHSERGVFTSPFRSNGDDEVLVAVDSDSHIIAYVVVTEPRARCRVLRSMWDILRIMDPPPRPLRRVK